MITIIVEELCGFLKEVLGKLETDKKEAGNYQHGFQTWLETVGIPPDVQFLHS